ncbi:uncharacterized protein LOC116922196 [Daphnia magna]|uniref:Uncharacterized protein n=2 Tax=Daphnia magna TaxID=35525 RepID=A0ABQ9ZBH2_9CRUS|nr:uncharacterized protein LOC116922196 [Daphnia magna]KAK4010256.1 hypothetical protein OUZ56_019405 [Daphnia magna]KZS14782.1 Uncharacterized protein APZ42_020151 [Daphnia magna]
MASMKLFVLLAVVVAMVAAYPQGYDAPYEAAPSSGYAAPAYKGGAGYANGRVKMQVYRGPSKGYEGKGGYGGDYGFAPWGFYVTQPEDNKAYGY